MTGAHDFIPPPAMLILRKATREEYLVFCVSQAATIQSGAPPHAYFYAVQTD